MPTIDLTTPPDGGPPPAGISTGLTGYLARPPGPGPWPGVVVIHEVFGVDAVMRRATDRIAAMGYLALLPDLLSQGRRLPCMISTVRTMMRGGGRAFSDLEAARQWLLADQDCTGRVGVLGFCMGGGFALVLAGRGYDAAAANYAILPRDLDGTMSDACPIVASYGVRDLTLRGAAARLEAALERAGISHDVKEYPEVGHAFLNDAPVGPRLLRPVSAVLMGARPDLEAGNDAWRRIGAFFAQHLG